MTCPKCHGLLLPDEGEDRMCVRCGNRVYADVPLAMVPESFRKREGTFINYSNKGRKVAR